MKVINQFGHTMASSSLLRLLSLSASDYCRLHDNSYHGANTNWLHFTAPTKTALLSSSFPTTPPVSGTSTDSTRPPPAFIEQDGHGIHDLVSCGWWKRNWWVQQHNQKNDFSNRASESRSCPMTRTQSHCNHDGRYEASVTS